MKNSHLYYFVHMQNINQTSFTCMNNKMQWNYSNVFNSATANDCYWLGLMAIYASLPNGSLWFLFDLIFTGLLWKFHFSEHMIFTNPGMKHHTWHIHAWLPVIHLVTYIPEDCITAWCKTTQIGLLSKNIITLHYIVVLLEQLLPLSCPISWFAWSYVSFPWFIRT